LADPAVWQSILRDQRIFLFLDLDGTLVEIAATPGEVSLSSEMHGCLEELANLPGTLIGVVSGRKMEEVQRLASVEKIFYVGLHGLEIAMPWGGKISYPAGEEVIAALRSMRDEWSRSSAAMPGIFLEDKGLTLALHFRLAKREDASKVMRDFFQIVGAYQKRGIPLEILEGKEVLEVKPGGIDKGTAVSCLLDKYGEGAVPVYLGDDVTDEAAFRSLRLRGITVLVAEVPRPTAASYYLRNPDEVYAFLKYLVLRREGRS
jgi:trehalose-phosphatase